MAKTKVDYKKIYDFLMTTKHRVITAYIIASGIGVDRIYGGTMSKLMREGWLEPCPLKGYYRIIKN